MLQHRHPVPSLHGADLAAALGNIRGRARHLAGTCHLPGMDSDDIAQDLFLDLWRRRQAFDPAKASFPTFADRVIANRIATLTAPTARLNAERRQVWLDEPLEIDGAATLCEVLADPAGRSELDLGLGMDVRQFVAKLTPALQRCCAMLLAPCLSEAATEAGLHRSTLYENIQRLRLQAVAAGLADYLPTSQQIHPLAGMCST